MNFLQEKDFTALYYFLILVADFQHSSPFHYLTPCVAGGVPNCSNTSGMKLLALLDLFSQITTGKLQRAVGELELA